MKMHRFLCRAVTAVGLAVLIGVAQPAAGQSVEAVVEKMRAHYEQQLAAVDTYIIETDQYTAYHRKVTRDGSVHYESETQWKEDSGGLMAPVTPSTQPGLGQLEALAENAQYLGTETIDGRRTHVILVEDPSVLHDTQAPSGEAATQGPMTMYIDAERYVPLRMEGTVKVQQGGTTQTIHPRIFFQDYRTVDGLTLPWTVAMKMENLNAAISPEEREEARKGLEEMEKQMQQMPEAQRKMMSGMMEDQLKRLRQIIEDGTLNYTIQVQDVKVNVPLPAGVFDESGSN